VVCPVRLRAAVGAQYFGAKSRGALWGGSAEVDAAQILGYVGCGAVLAGIVFVMSVVAVPLIIDRHASASDAIRASLRATLFNLPAMLVWAVLIVD